jgi:integrase
MVSGHLQEKNGYYHIVLNYVDSDSKRRTKWISTGLKLKGNKRKAEQMLMEARLNFKIPTSSVDGSISFTDYMKEWLKSIKPNVELTTYISYEAQLKKICAYFGDEIKLQDISAQNIQNFYTYAISECGVSANTVGHYHANINKALQHAVRMKVIPENPAKNVEKPRIQKFVSTFYTVDEINALLAAAKGLSVELAIILASFYGLRRSEVAGLKWDAIDFNNKTITIKHTVVSVSLDGKYVLVAKDRAKTKSSLRSLPLVASFEKYLLRLREQQNENRRLCGECYNSDYSGYIYVDKMGNLINPRTISANFRALLRRNNLKKIRYHELRHSCASVLLANGVTMKEIQDWLGHSNFSTTANTYAHLDKSAKINSANAMLRSGINI